MSAFDQDVARRLEEIDALERLDPAWSREVRDHEVRVAQMASSLARDIGMSPQAVSQVYWGGRFHDIGKLSINPEILFKPGRLEPDERREMEEHTVRGVDLLTEGNVPVPSFLLDAAHYHHESYNGRGYHGLAREAIPFIARIIAIADVHDALRAERAYKSGMSEDQALLLMSRDDTGFGRYSFDPVLLRAFVDMRLETHGTEMKREAIAQLMVYATSDPMDDLPADSHVTIKRDGHRILWAPDAEGRRKQVALVRPDGDVKIMAGMEAAHLLPPIREERDRQAASAHRTLAA